MKSFREGGITIKQFNALFEQLQKIEYDKFKIQAKMQGIEFKDDKNGAGMTDVDPAVPLFKDPSEYEGMTEEERESLTQKMMGKHKSFVNKQRVI